MEDDAPAQTGEVQIANMRGLGGYVKYRWPVDAATEMRPEMYLLLRLCDSGDWSLAIEEDWR